MHEPKFTKKCYDCTNRFLCWTNKETPNGVEGLPLCSRCGTRLEIIDQPYWRKLDISKSDKDVDDYAKVLCVKAQCPEHKWYNWHDRGTYMEIKPEKWVRVFSLWA